MMDFKSMSTQIVSNLRKLHESNSGYYIVDPTLYKQIIGSLMYLLHSRPDICYDVSILIYLLLSMCLDTFEVLLLMDSDMPPVEELCYLVMQTLTRVEVLWTEREHLDFVLAWEKL